LAIDLDEAIPWAAIEGKMGDRTFYMTVLSLKTVARYFEPTAPTLPAEQRAQRALSERRVPDIKQYMLDKEQDWVFGSLTISFDGEVEYEPKKRILYLDPSTDFVVVDGQHRLAGIKRAIEEDPLLRDQSIGVMLLAFEDLSRNQQVFSDLNRTVQKTSRSLDILYDHDDPMTGVVKYVAQQVPLFKNRVEKNQTSLAVRSKYFITLSSLYDACRQLLGGARGLESMKDDEDAVNAAQELCVRYWTKLSEVIEPWREVREGDIKPAEARIENVVAHAVAFFALGSAGAQVLGIKGKDDWGRVTDRDLEMFDQLKDVDWHKTNEDWQGIAMLGSAVVTRHQTRQALSRKICHYVDPERFPDVQPVL
jgi:DNA sulfur modification protein DndB